MEELLLKIKELNDDQREYVSFYLFYKIEDAKMRDEIFDSLREKEIDVFKPYMLAVLFSGLSSKISTMEIEELKIAEQNYNDILMNTKQLANELKLESSLELANLFTYLLWNGYFSKDRLLSFKSSERSMIPDYYAFDIMNGSGVCLNYSDMFSDFMNQFEYFSASIINTFNVKDKPNYRPAIDRNVANGSGRKLFSKMLIPVSNKSGNHAFNLIGEGEKLYIYDSTNLMMFNIQDRFNCLNVCGTGGCIIKPYFSHYLNSSEKSLTVLGKLNMKTDFVSPYTGKDFIFTWEECLENFKGNEYLLNCFYDEIKGNIEVINGNVKTIKKIIKDKKRNSK